MQMVATRMSIGTLFFSINEYIKYLNRWSIKYWSIHKMEFYVYKNDIVDHKKDIVGKLSDFKRFYAMLKVKSIYLLYLLYEHIVKNIQ